MPATIATPKSTSKLQYVNALRGLAILSVVLVHNGEYGPDLAHFPTVLQRVIDQGARGVQLFFVASAFTLFLSMSKRKQEQYPTRNFFIRRFFRIAPMYYLGIAFYTFWFAVVLLQPVTKANILANLTFLHGINPYWINSLVPGGWSITVEMWFYCLAPWLFTKLTTVDRAIRFIVYGILVNCILSIIFTPLHPLTEEWRWLSFIFLYFPSQLPVFGFGILLYLVLTDSSQIKRVSHYTLLLTAGVLLFTLMTGFGNSEQQLFGIASQGQHYWFGAAFFILALGLSQLNPWFLVNPILSYIGEVSFSLYLVHFAVLFILKYLNYSGFIQPTRMATAVLDFGLRYILVVTVSTALATVFYRLVEVPFQNLGKRLIIYLEK